MIRPYHPGNPHDAALSAMDQVVGVQVVVPEGTDFDPAYLEATIARNLGDLKQELVQWMGQRGHQASATYTLDDFFLLALEAFTVLVGQAVCNTWPNQQEREKDLCYLLHVKEPHEVADLYGAAAARCGERAERN